MRTIANNPFAGFFQAGSALNRKPAYDAGFDAESARLMEQEKMRSAMETAGAQRQKFEADAAKTNAEAQGIASGFDFFKNAQNAAPVAAARANVPVGTAKQYIASLTGHGGPMVAPQMDNVQQRMMAEAFASHWNAQGAGKASGLSDVAKFTEGSMRNAQAMIAPEQAASDPITAAFRLAVGNDQKSTPKLFDNVGNVGKINTLTGDLSIDPALVEKQAQARMPWDWMIGANGQPMPRPGGAADNSIQDRAARADQARLDRDQREAERKAQATERKVTKFSAELDKSNVPAFESALANVESLIKRYQDLPGFGFGVGGLPDFLVTKEGQELRQAVQALANIVIKDRSGAAVTNQELKRFLKEIGSGALRNDQQLRTGLENLRRSFDEIKRNVVAGVDDETLNLYEQQGGMAFDRSKRSTGQSAPSAPAQSAPKRAAPKPGEMIEGYRFKGGNPNDRNNWERAS
jgi:hypothetical protein